MHVSGEGNLIFFTSQDITRTINHRTEAVVVGITRHKRAGGGTARVVITKHTTDDDGNKGPICWKWKEINRSSVDINEVSGQCRIGIYVGSLEMSDMLIERIRRNPTSGEFCIEK